jgi:hypothetical protein
LTTRDRRRLVVHVDNAGPHLSTRVKQYFEDHSLRTALYPFYSPDLAPTGFFLFGYRTMTLQGSEFESAEELLEAVVRILNAIPTNTLIGTFHQWIKRFQAYLDNDGEYVE